MLPRCLHIQFFCERKKKKEIAEFAFRLFCFILFEDRQMKRSMGEGVGGTLILFLKLFQAIQIGGWQRVILFN